MSKKKTDVKEVVESVESTETENLESIQVTPEQKEEFVNFMAAKKKEAKAEDEVEKFSMNLLYTHSINGRRYGPGPAVIPAYHVDLIQHQELNKKNAEISLNTSSNRMYKIMDSGQSIPVPVKG